MNVEKEMLPDASPTPAASIIATIKNNRQHKTGDSKTLSHRHSLHTKSSNL